MVETFTEHEIYWSIGTDIHLSFPTKEEFNDAKKRVSKAMPIKCKTCLHENNADGKCGFYNSKIWDDKKKELVPVNMCGNCISCTYYDPIEEEVIRVNELRKLIKNNLSTLEYERIMNPEAYKVYVELIENYGCDPL